MDSYYSARLHFTNGTLYVCYLQFASIYANPLIPAKLHDSIIYHPDAPIESKFSETRSVEVSLILTFSPCGHSTSNIYFATFYFLATVDIN